MGFKNKEKIKAAERKAAARRKAAEDAAKKYIKRLTEDPAEKTGLVAGKIGAAIAGIAANIYYPGSGPVVQQSLNALVEGSIAASYAKKGKPELAEAHGYQAAGGLAGAVGSGASAQAAREAVDDPSTPDVDEGGQQSQLGALGSAGRLGSQLLAREAALAAPTPGSMDYETARIYDEKFGAAAARESKLAEAAAASRLKSEQRRAAAFGPDPFALAAAPTAEPAAAPLSEGYMPEPPRGNPTTPATVATGTSPGSGLGGQLPPEAQTSGQYGTKQLALTAEGSPGPTSISNPTQQAESMQRDPWYETVGQYSTDIDPGYVPGTSYSGGLVGALGTGVTAAGRTGQILSGPGSDETKGFDITATWLDWMINNAKRSSGQPTTTQTNPLGQATAGAAKEFSGIDPSILSLFT